MMGAPLNLRRLAEAGRELLRIRADGGNKDTHPAEAHRRRVAFREQIAALEALPALTAADAQLPRGLEVLAVLFDVAREAGHGDLVDAAQAELQAWYRENVAEASEAWWMLARMADSKLQTGYYHYALEQCQLEARALLASRADRMPQDLLDAIRDGWAHLEDDPDAGCYLNIWAGDWYSWHSFGYADRRAWHENPSGCIIRPLAWPDIPADVRPALLSAFRDVADVKKRRDAGETPEQAPWPWERE